MWGWPIMKGMRFELWEGSNEDGGRESRFLADSDQQERAKLADAPYLKCTWTVEANTLDQAIHLLYDHMGWSHHDETWEGVGLLSGPKLHAQADSNSGLRNSAMSQAGCSLWRDVASARESAVSW